MTQGGSTTQFSCQLTPADTLPWRHPHRGWVGSKYKRNKEHRPQNLPSPPKSHHCPLACPDRTQPSNPDPSPTPPAHPQLSPHPSRTWYVHVSHPPAGQAPIGQLAHGGGGCTGWGAGPGGHCEGGVALGPQHLGEEAAAIVQDDLGKGGGAK